MDIVAVFTHLVPIHKNTLFFLGGGGNSFRGFSDSRRGGPAAVCDPNPPRPPFARSRETLDV